MNPKAARSRMDGEGGGKEALEGGSHIPGGLCLGVSGTRTASVKSLRWEDPWKKNTEAREAGTR